MSSIFSPEITRIKVDNTYRIGYITYLEIEFNNKNSYVMYECESKELAFEQIIKDLEESFKLGDSIKIGDNYFNTIDKFVKQFKKIHSI